MAARIDNEATGWLHEHRKTPFSLPKGFVSLLLQVNVRKSDIMAYSGSSKWSMSTTIMVSEKISSTIPFLPFIRDYGGVGAPGMSTWQLRGKTLNVAPPAGCPPVEPRERSLRGTSVHIRASLSSISQESENSKKVYSALTTQDILSARMPTETVRGKSCHKPTRKTQLTVT